MRTACVIALAAAVGGCATSETVRFQPTEQQQAMVRDGQAALMSRKKNSLVLVRPASRQFATGSRPVYVVGIYNLTGGPLEFRVANIEAVQIADQQTVPMKIFTYEDLVAEERNRQIAAALLTGLAAGANAYSASQAGRYSQTSTVHTPRGTYQVHTTGYSPTANAIAQSNASAQNEAMISATIERGQQNLAALEQGVIKDNTLFPGEWYGGQLHLQPPSSDIAKDKRYTVALRVGADRHVIDIAHDNAR